MECFHVVKTETGASREECVAVEEPLQITIDGHPVAVVMRTPGDDEDLVTGFLITEAILSEPGQIRRIEVRDNQALVFLHDGVEVDIGGMGRNLYSASSCGICGKASVDRVFLNFPPLPAPCCVKAEHLLAAPDRLKNGQIVFRSTGGLHAAGLFDDRGDMICVREDVGRHNAVDKVIGHALFNNLPLSGGFLMVSGRVSFEVMQKALGARIPAVAAVSAPSSLAVEFARRSGQVLVGFLRPPRFNVYSGEVG